MDLWNRPQPTPTGEGQSIARRRSFNTFAGFAAVFVAVYYVYWMWFA